MRFVRRARTFVAILAAGLTACSGGGALASTVPGTIRTDALRTPTAATPYAAIACKPKFNAFKVATVSRRNSMCTSRSRYRE